MSAVETGPAPGGLPVGLELGEPVDLGGSDRSQVVRREVLAGPASWGRSVVIKRYRPQPSGAFAEHGYRRERTGLALLPATPRLLAHDDRTGTIVMEDLGTRATLADLLLTGGGPRAADDAYRAVLDWAGALGRTLRVEPEVITEARRALGSEVLAADRDLRRSYARRGLTHLRAVTGIRAGAAAASVVEDVLDWLDGDEDRHVLGPGDACPDNAVITGEGVRFLDLEGAGVRHAAWEAAYAAEPFCTCWCVYGTPEGLTASMTAAFTAGLHPSLPPSLRTPAADRVWREQVRAAVAAWVVCGTLWLLDGAVEGRVMNPDRGGPPFRALLMSRWRWVARECVDDLPDLAAACEEAISWGHRVWGTGPEVRLPRYPVWR